MSHRPTEKKTHNEGHSTMFLVAVQYGTAAYRHRREHCRLELRLLSWIGLGMLA